MGLKTQFGEKTFTGKLIYSRLVPFGADIKIKHIDFIKNC